MVLAVNAINSLSRTLLNYAKDDFKDTPEFLKPSPIRKEIKSKIDMAQKIIDKIHEISGMTDTNLSNDIDKIDDILRQAKKIRDNYSFLSSKDLSFFCNLFFNTANKTKKLIESIQLEKNNLVKKYS